MEYIYIGKFKDTYALKGEIKVTIDTDFIKERYAKDSLVYLKINDEYKAYTVERYRLYKDSLIVKFKEVNDINDIEKYKGLNIYKKKDDIKPLDNNEYYFSDLVHLDVYDNDRLIGKVINVEEGIKQNLLRIKKVDGNIILVPYVKAFIKEVNLQNKCIYINVIEGLI